MAWVTAAPEGGACVLAGNPDQEVDNTDNAGS